MTVEATAQIVVAVDFLAMETWRRVLWPYSCWIEVQPLDGGPPIHLCPLLVLPLVCLRTVNELEQGHVGVIVFATHGEEI